MALALLPPRPAAWQYRHRNASLHATLQRPTTAAGAAPASTAGSLASRDNLAPLPPAGGAAAAWQDSGEAHSQAGAATALAAQQEDASDEEPPVVIAEEVEDIIGALLQALRDPDTVVRYASCQGVQQPVIWLVEASARCCRRSGIPAPWLRTSVETLDVQFICGSCCTLRGPLCRSQKVCWLAFLGRRPTGRLLRSAPLLISDHSDCFDYSCRPCPWQVVGGQGAGSRDGASAGGGGERGPRQRAAGVCHGHKLQDLLAAVVGATCCIRVLRRDVRMVTTVSSPSRPGRSSGREH